MLGDFGQASLVSSRKLLSRIRARRSSVGYRNPRQLVDVHSLCFLVAIAAAEAQNPKLSLPRAIKVVWIRVLMFYVSSSAIIGLIVSSNDIRLGRDDGTAFSSPFVIAIEASGIKVRSPLRLPWS